MDPVERWIADSPYSRFLGVELALRGDDTLVLRLPYKDENSNPGKALHGGCAASLGAIGAQALTRAALGPDTGTWHTAGLQVSYLAAAIGETILARARLLRRGKEMCFAEVDIETEDAKPIAHVTAAVRARFGAPAPDLPKSAGDHGRAEPGTMGPHIGSIAFIGESRHPRRAHDGRHLAAGHALARHQRGSGRERPRGRRARAARHHGRDGLVGRDRTRAATRRRRPRSRRSSSRRAGRSELVAYGRCVLRDRELLWSDVDVVRREDSAICARGTVIYRILT